MTFVRVSTREPERQPIADEETWSAIEYLIRRKHRVRVISGAIVVDQMNLTAAHVKGLARQKGWGG